MSLGGLRIDTNILVFCVLIVPLVVAGHGLPALTLEHGCVPVDVGVSIIRPN